LKPRHLFFTKTIQGAIGMMAGFAIATAPLIEISAPLIRDFIDRKVDKEKAEDLKFYLGLAVAIGGFIGTAYGRHQATPDVFTPPFLPGRSKKDVMNTGEN
jgi:hypothetical protein